MPDPVPISKVTGKPRKGPPNINHTKAGKCTNAEKEVRLEKLATLLGKRLKRHEIRAFCKSEWNIGWRHADRYWAYAVAAEIKRSNRSKDELRCEAVAFYESVIRNPKNDDYVKTSAQRELNAIYGLYAPKGIRVADEQGKPLQAVLAPVVNFIMPSNGRDTVKPVK